MSVTQTFTVTVVGGNPSNHPYYNFGSSNKYAIGGSTATADVTLALVEGGTYRFDQSDSSNSNHPLRFSTTPNGTHSGGSEYTTGVTTNGTPGSSGAYTEITVADDAPTLYYYCTNHSGMGWTANTDPVGKNFTVTVVSTGSGNKYVIDGTQQATLELVEGGTFRLDQSDSSNSGHPLRFSTTSGGSHSGGSEYTTGVTTIGTPGSSGAYTQITVAADAPTLYYYCTVHSGMGGQANTPTTDFWGAGNWSANLWGISEAFVTGWGAKAWNDGEWSQLSDETVTLSGQSITSSVGDVAAFPLQGWGSDSWGDEAWGESSFTVELTAPDAITSSVSVGSGFGDGSYGQEQGWGQFVLNPADVMGLTGVSSTSGVGSVSFTISAEFALSGVAITSGVGAIDPTAEIVGPTGQQITSSVGSIAPADAIGLTGVSATLSVGSVDIASNPVVSVTGQAMTSSVGSIDPLAIVQGLTGVSATASVGSPLVADFAIGLTGVSATSSVAGFGTATGFGIQAYSDVDTGSNTSYTDVA